MPLDEYQILQSTFPFLEKSDINALVSISKPHICHNKEVIIERGSKAQRIFFIVKGMVRGYFINEKGEEKNIFLRPEHTLTGAPDTLFSGLATKYTFQAILETHLLIYDFQEFKNLAVQYPNLTQLYIAGLQENVQTLIGRVESLIDQTPEERYDALLERSPQFFQTAFNKHIANYLGITAVSLSRIIRRKNNPNT